MIWLYGTGFMRWFWSTWLVTLLFWPVTMLLHQSSSGWRDELPGILAGPFIALPYTLPVALGIAMVAFVPAVVCWWLARRMTAWLNIHGRLAAGVAGIAVTLGVLAPLTWFSGMMSGEEPEGLGPRAFVYFILHVAGPVTAIAGPFLAVTLTWERFLKP